MTTKLLSRNKPELHLAWIVLAAVLLRIFFFSGYVSGDDAAYAARAFVYSQGNFITPYDHWGARIGIVLPTAASYKLFGVSHYSTVLWPFLCSVGTVILGYLLSNRLFNRETALITAFLIAIFPMEVLFASQLFPYALLSFFSTASLLCFVKGLDDNKNLYLFLCGLMIGVAYLCRITSLFCVLFFGLHYLYARRLNLRYGLIALGLLLVIGLESLIGAGMSDDPVIRFNVLSARESAKAGVDVTLSGLTWVVEPFLRPLLEQEYGAFFYLMLPALLLTLRKFRDERIMLLLLWVVPIYLYLSYGTTSLSAYSPLERLPRYASIVVVPWLALLAFLMTTSCTARIRVASLIFLLATSLLALMIDNSPHTISRESKLADIIASRPGDTFVVPRPIYFDLLYLNRFEKPANTVLFSAIEDSSDGLKRILLAAPEAARVPSLKTVCAAHIVDDGFYYRAGVGDALDEREIELTIPEPQRFYHRLLQYPIALKVLGLVRGKHRIAQLQRLRQNNFVIYKPDRKCRD